MDFFTKNKVLFWCVIILVLINVITLVSFWMGKPPVGPQRGAQGKPDGGKIMEQRLGLSAGQAEQFERIRNEHFMRTRPLQDDMHKINMDLLNELFTSEPDETKIQKLISDFGDKQVQFEKNLFRHFRELKDACNNDKQVEELKIMLRDLIESTRPREPRHHQPGQPEGMAAGHRPAPPNR